MSARPCGKMAVHAVAAAVLLGISAGRTEKQLSDGFSWNRRGEEPRVPQRMTIVRDYTVLRQARRPGVSGFGGRIMFYTAGGKKPVKVDGALTVAAFDATVEDPARIKPEKKFIFTSEDLPRHYSKSDLGHSYSFWVPWDEVGGARRRLALIARFEASTGEVIVSDTSSHILHGFATAPRLPANLAHGRTATADTMVEPVLHEAPLGAAYAKPRKQMTTSTIELTPSFTQQIIAAGPERSATSPVNAAGVAGPPVATSPAATGQNAWQWSSPQLVPPGQPRPTRFAPQRFPARRGSIVAPRSDPVRRQPLPATWPSQLPPTPRHYFYGPPTNTGEAAGSIPY